MTMTRGQLPRTTVRGVRKRSVGGWDVRLDGPDPIGYLQITEITASTPHELRKWARQLESEGNRALVLDLRGLHGTSLHPTVILADALLDRGTIGRVRTLQGETTYQADPDTLFRGWPLVVLVDFTTSGTAEWLAAALQDNRRAVLVGTPTNSTRAVPGDAVVRSTVPVGDGAWSVTLVTGCLQRGDGRPLSFFGRSLVGMTSEQRTKVGVHPDHAIDGDSRGRAGFMVPTRPPQEPSSATDPALRKAIQVLGSSLRKP
jgi:carboxyl-terminal processing protease